MSTVEVPISTRTDAAAPVAGVEALLAYLAPSAERPSSYTYAPPPGVPQRSGRADRRLVWIRDARALPEAASLDREGFELVEHPSAMRDFYDAEQVRSLYYPEVESLLRSVTGATKIVIFDHTLRAGSPEQRKQKGVQEPVRSVHNDYTARSGLRRVGDHLEAEEAADRLRSRHAIVNVWRAIRGPIEEAPLAVCDAQSVEPEDLVATDLIYPDRIGEVYSVHYNAAHRWYYYPAMRGDEALLIKTYDSAEDGRARFSAHSAFDDPTSRPGSAPRESIEVRALVFF
jgi:hypothetical protein